MEESQRSNTENVSNDGNISGEKALLDQAPVSKTKRKMKAQRVSLDAHAVLLDASVKGELDIVKHSEVSECFVNYSVLSDSSLQYLTRGEMNLAGKAREVGLRRIPTKYACVHDFRTRMCNFFFTCLFS